MAYRCQGCREYRPSPPWRKVGLGGVCSTECADALRSKTKAKPKPKLHPRTKLSANPDVPAKTRALVMQRDRGKCRWCGSASSLHLHHVQYRSHGVDHQPHNLITLCQTHHDQVHSNKRRWTPLCLAYIWLATVENRFYLLPQLERKLR